MRKLERLSQQIGNIVDADERVIRGLQRVTSLLLHDTKLEMISKRAQLDISSKSNSSVASSKVKKIWSFKNLFFEVVAAQLAVFIRSIDARAFLVANPDGLAGATKEPRFCPRIAAKRAGSIPNSKNWKSCSAESESVRRRKRQLRQRTESLFRNDKRLFLKCFRKKRFGQNSNVAENRKRLSSWKRRKRCSNRVSLQRHW